MYIAIIGKTETNFEKSKNEIKTDIELALVQTPASRL
jgi:hypothetical protein